MLKIGQGVIITAITGFFIAALYVYLRSNRLRRSNSNYATSNRSKSLWGSWAPRFVYGRLSRNQDSSSRDLHTRDTSYNPSLASPEQTSERATEVSAAQNGVDRNTSVRSIITLPPYNPSLHPTERLIAREGERAGIDTVVEFPETAEEEEEQREEDMEALYQIRQARRREIEEREQRRQERQQAREAGDWARLEQLRLESQRRARARAQSATSSSTSLTPATTSNSLIMEHNARTASRERRVSSVSYAELGLARHDGSRLRADSVESNDQRPLLDSAASMGGRDSSRRSSLFQPSHAQNHHRNPSGGSHLSHDSDTQDTPRTSTAGDRSASASRMQTPSANAGTANEHFPPPDPPEYDQVGFEDDEAPPYASPVLDRGEAPQLPVIPSVPVIQVTGTTPANSVPVTPVDGLGTEGRGRR